MLLTVAPPPDVTGVLWWVVSVAAMLVAVVVVAIMRQRNDDLVTQLHDIARTDALTGLTNRRGFRETFDREIERARRDGLAFALVVSDIDHFKQVNDRQGHPQGDLVLGRVAHILDGGKRRIDTAARVGGEEFAMLLPGVEAAGAFVLAERLRRQVREHFADDPVPVTMSFGIACFPADGETVAALLRRGDQALYRAKQEGRDRTVDSSGSTPESPSRDDPHR